MLIETYQSKFVLKILQAGETYRAKPNLSLHGEYAALIDMLGLKCECPIFGVIKGRKQKTGGKVSDSVKLTLDVPEKHLHFTEYDRWADFLEAYKFSKPGNYKLLMPYCEEITTRDYNELINELKEQKKPNKYIYPQVILEKISPSWLKKHHYVKKKSSFGIFLDRLANYFRK